MDKTIWFFYFITEHAVKNSLKSSIDDSEVDDEIISKDYSSYHDNSGKDITQIILM